VRQARTDVIFVRRARLSTRVTARSRDRRNLAPPPSSAAPTWARSRPRDEQEIYFESSTRAGISAVSRVRQARTDVIFVRCARLSTRVTARSRDRRNLAPPPTS